MTQQQAADALRAIEKAALDYAAHRHLGSEDVLTHLATLRWLWGLAEERRRFPESY